MNMSDIYGVWSYNDAALYHHGIKGMKWGVRRYQNPDGTLTAEGRKRYGTAEKMYYERAKEARKKANRSAVANVAAYSAATIGAAAACKVGAGTVAYLLGGPAGAMTINALAAYSLYNRGKQYVNMNKYTNSRRAQKKNITGLHELGALKRNDTLYYDRRTGNYTNKKPNGR